MGSWLRAASGRLAVALLRGIGRLPPGLVVSTGTLFLPLYLPFRRATRARLRNLAPPVGAFAYYRMRLRLAHLSVRQALGRPDGCTLRVEGGELFADARASGRPVVLFGWHQGPVELLHRVPAAAHHEPGTDAEDRKEGDASRRDGRRADGFYLLTAAAFSPALATWMAARRARDGMRVLPPGDRAALRDWTRGGGTLAVMIDQVPGEPEDRLSLRGGAVSVPWPRRLVAWIETQRPVRLAVSVRWERGERGGSGDRVVFRYQRLEERKAGAEATKDGIARLMDDALARAPEQYNWSYGKCRVAGAD